MGGIRFAPATDTELLESLRRIAALYGGRPSARFLNMLAKEGKAFWDTTYGKHFGSYADALKKAEIYDLPIIGKPVDWGKRGYAGIRRSRRIPGRISDKIRFQILTRDGFRCVYCGQSPRDGIVLNVDHLVPVGAGGETTAQNLVTSCRRCNGGKYNTILDLEHMLLLRTQEDAH